MVGIEMELDGETDGGGVVNFADLIDHITACSIHVSLNLSDLK